MRTEPNRPFPPPTRSLDRDSLAERLLLALVARAAVVGRAVAVAGRAALHANQERRLCRGRRRRAWCWTCSRPPARPTGWASSTWPAARSIRTAARSRTIAGPRCTTSSAARDTPCSPCGRARSPSSRLAEMAKNLKQGVVWVKEHADEYKIDPDAAGHHRRLGRRAPGFAGGGDGRRQDRRSRRPACSFRPPIFSITAARRSTPTPTPAKLERASSASSRPVGDAGQRLGAGREAEGESAPRCCVTAKAPPFLIIHGDADPLVPLGSVGKAAGGPARPPACRPS